MKYNKNILTVEEQTIINQSVKDAENEGYLIFRVVFSTHFFYTHFSI